MELPNVLFIFVGSYKKVFRTGLGANQQIDFAVDAAIGLPAGFMFGYGSFGEPVVHTHDNFDF